MSSQISLVIKLKICLNIMNIKQKQKVVIKNVEVIKELSVVNNLRSN